MKVVTVTHLVCPWWSKQNRQFWFSLSSIFFGHPVLSHWKIWDKRYNLVGQDEVETQVVTEGISWQVRLHLSIRRESSEKAHNSAIAAPVSHCKFNSTNDGESSNSKSVFLKLFCYFYSKMVLDDLILAVKTLVNVFLFFSIIWNRFLR